MGILSSIGSAISSAVSKAVSAVKSVVSSVSSALGGGSSSSSSAGNVSSSSSGGTSGGSSLGSGGGTYNSSTGVYTDSSGQGFSTTTPPADALVIGGGGGGTGTSQMSVSSGGGEQIQTPHGTATVTSREENGAYQYTTEDGSNYFVDANGMESIMFSGQASGVMNIGEPLITDQGIGVFVDSYLNNIKTSSNWDALALATGVAGFIKALAVKGTTIASGQVLQGTAGKAAGGKIIQTTLSTQTPAFVVNTKTASLTGSYLTKLVGTLKNPMVTLGLISTVAYTSLFWAPNEKGDALTTLGIVQGAAAREGDTEMVSQIDQLIQETNDIVAGIPILGFLQAEKAKFEAAAIASEVYKRNADKVVQDAQNKLIADEEKRKSDALIYGQLDPVTGEYILSPTELAKRKEAEEYYAGIEKQKQLDYEDRQQEGGGREVTEEQKWAKVSEEDRAKIEIMQEKVNRGEPLTQLEEELLRYYAITLTKQTTPKSTFQDESGQSALGFGLLR